MNKTDTLEADAPAVPQEPVAIIRCWTKNGEGHSELVDWCCPGIESLPDGEHKLFAAPQQRPRLTEREIDLLDGMIEVQLQHAARCDAIPNRTMAEKQKGWDMERVTLLRKVRGEA